MLVILKIPVVYLCWVVWWAVRAEPEPLEGAGRLVAGPAASSPTAAGGADGSSAAAAAVPTRAAADASTGRDASPTLAVGWNRELVRERRRTPLVDR